MTWYILSNKSDCGDLSIYKTEGSEEKALKYMKALMMSEAANADPGDIVQFMTNGREGYIRYCDEERSDYRIICEKDVVDVCENDEVKDVEIDIISAEDFDMDTEAVDYAIHDIGREPIILSANISTLCFGDKDLKHIKDRFKYVSGTIEAHTDLSHFSSSAQQAIRKLLASAAVRNQAKMRFCFYPSTITKQWVSSLFIGDYCINIYSRPTAKFSELIASAHDLAKNIEENYTPQKIQEHLDEAVADGANGIYTDYSFECQDKKLIIEAIVNLCIKGAELDDITLLYENDYSQIRIYGDALEYTQTFSTMLPGLVVGELGWDDDALEIFLEGRKAVAGTDYEMELSVEHYCEGEADTEDEHYYDLDGKVISMDGTVVCYVGAGMIIENEMEEMANMATHVIFR